LFGGQQLSLKPYLTRVARSHSPTNALNRIKKRIEVLKEIPTCFGAEAPSSASHKYKRVKAPINNLKSTVSSINMVTNIRVVKHIKY